MFYELLNDNLVAAARRVRIPTTPRGWLSVLIIGLVYAAVYWLLGKLKNPMTDKIRNTVAFIITIVLLIICMIAFDIRID